MVMKKSNQLKKKILAIFLTVLMIATTIPLNVFAASNMNLILYHRFYIFFLHIGLPDLLLNIHCFLPLLFLSRVL